MPKICIEENKLIACTDFITKIMTLFAFSTYVVVDRQFKLATIKKNILWFFTTKQMIHFNNIQKIAYSYEVHETEEYDREIEKFTVSLDLIKPHDRVKLFTFGNEEESRTYVDLLMSFTGKKLT